ncbi:MAG: hypothetical protein IT269_06480, partial [Saprospiraceae bacterium]|nr:hypothetical protein [Saprospiraceae bacterium]
MLALLRALAIFGLLFVFHTVPLFSQAVAPDLQAFAAMSSAERSAYIFQLNLELRDTSTFLQEYHALLDVARKAGDHRAVWALDFEFFQQRPDFKWPQEMRLSSIEKLYKTASEAGWDVEEIVALHYLQFEKYNYKLILHEKLYAHILTEFERMKSVGLEQFKYFEPARILFHDAKFMYELDDLEKALNILKSVEPFCKPDDRGLQTWVLNTNLISSTYQQQGNYEEGIVYAKKILEVASNCPGQRPPQISLCQVWQSIATVDIANMLVKQGKMTEGEIYADKGYAFLHGDFERQAVFDALLVLAPTKLSLGKIEESGQLLKRMEEILNEVPAEQQNYFYFKKVRFYET